MIIVHPSLRNAAAGKGSEEPCLELVVHVYNINEGKNADIAGKCRVLHDYAAFVAKVRSLEKTARKTCPGIGWKEAQDKAIAETITYCKTHDILKEYLESLTMEELNMLTQEWNQEEALAVIREEALEEGWERGREEGWERGREEERSAIFSLWRQGYTPEQVERILAERGTLKTTTSK